MKRRTGFRSLVVFLLVVVVGLIYTEVAGNRPLLGLDLQGGLSVTLQAKGNPTSDAVEQAKEIIRSRVDGLGVAEPDIVRQGKTVIIQLPGIKDPDRARALIGDTAKLEFRPVLSQLQTPVPTTAAPTTTAPGAPTTTAPGATSTVPGATTAPVDPNATTTAPAATAPASTPSDNTGNSLGRPTDGPNAAGAQTPTTTPLPADPNAATTTAPADPNATTLPVDPNAATTTAPAGINPGVAACSNQTPPDQPCVGNNPDGPGSLSLGPAGTGTGPQFKATPGQAVASAEGALNQGTGQWEVAISIKGRYKSAINALFNACYSGGAECPPTGQSNQGGSGGRVAIVLDGKILSAPVVNSLNLADQSFRITGSFTKGQADDLALKLKYGALPVEFNVGQFSDVSATLGKDYLHAGLISGFVGLALVALYMLVYYRLLGAVAIASLASGAALLWVVISYLGDTRGLALTLAGITGIIVSIGVAVDSNVVFYEHLREDVAAGRTLRSAVGTSFDSAWRTIVSADLVSLIGAGLLYWLTVGAVRGFAFYLGLSTILDLLASYFFMRPVVLWLARSERFQDRPEVVGIRVRPSSENRLAEGPAAGRRRRTAKGAAT